MADTRDAWAAFLNPEVVRAKLIAAGLFLVAHEMLINSIKRHPLSFFADCWTAKGPAPSKKYSSKVLALDPKGKMDALRGSIAWLRMMDAISENDEQAFRIVSHASSSPVTGLLSKREDGKVGKWESAVLSSKRTECRMHNSDQREGDCGQSLFNLRCRSQASSSLPNATSPSMCIIHAGPETIPASSMFW